MNTFYVIAITQIDIVETLEPRTIAGAARLFQQTIAVVFKPITDEVNKIVTKLDLLFPQLLKK